MCMMAPQPTYDPPKKRVEKEADPNAIYELESGKKVGEKSDESKIKKDTERNPGLSASSQSSKTDKAY